MPLSVIEKVYKHFSDLVNKVYNKTQWIVEDICDGINDKNNPLTKTISAFDVETKFECTELPLDKPALCAEQIMNRLNELASRTVLVHNSIRELFLQFPTQIADQLKQKYQ